MTFNVCVIWDNFIKLRVCISVKKDVWKLCIHRSNKGNESEDKEVCVPSITSHAFTSMLPSISFSWTEYEWGLIGGPHVLPLAHPLPLAIEYESGWMEATRNSYTYHAFPELASLPNPSESLNVWASMKHTESLQTDTTSTKQQSIPNLTLLFFFLNLRIPYCSTFEPLNQLLPWWGWVSSEYYIIKMLSDVRIRRFFKMVCSITGENK